MMTIEGQPLSENVKKRRDALVAYATARRRRTAGSSRTRAARTTTRRSGDQRAHRPHRPGLPEGGGERGGPPAGGVHRRQPGRPRARRRDAVAAAEPDGERDVADALQERLRGEDHPGRGHHQPLAALRAQHHRRQPRAARPRLHGARRGVGFFICKFYQDDPLSDDDWQVILVDDRIPCDAAGVPCFARCKVGRVSTWRLTRTPHSSQLTSRSPPSPQDDNVFRAMIVEKAFAKYLGCYDRMAASTVTQGLEDLTGGIGYKFDLEKPKRRLDPSEGEHSREAVAGDDGEDEDEPRDRLPELDVGAAAAPDDGEGSSSTVRTRWSPAATLRTAS